VEKEQTHYGPFVSLVASAYLWGMLGALLLLIDGCSLLTTYPKTGRNVVR